MSKRNTKEDRKANPQDYVLHPTKGYRRLRPYIRQYIKDGESMYAAFMDNLKKEENTNA